ncbi:hypothetical protein [Planotetraspora sp. GP83]|uniref:hypothetical protein n=1 Tax=Planotetraspora sp. GP83 TaxID=3156264 RepID=UPI003514C783
MEDQDLIRRVADLEAQGFKNRAIGHTLGSAGMQEKPEWIIDWEDGKPSIALSPSSARATATFISGQARRHAIEGS